MTGVPYLMEHAWLSAVAVDHCIEHHFGMEEDQGLPVVPSPVSRPSCRPRETSLSKRCEPAKSFYLSYIVVCLASVFL